MTALILTAYVLMWPAIVAVVLFVICRGFVKEWLQSRRDGEPII